MENVSERVKRITEDLRALQQDFYAAAFEDDQKNLDEIIDGLTDFQLITDLKSTVDYMRHVLWAYIEAVSKTDHTRKEFALETSRLNRATEMLKLLRLRFGTAPEAGPGKPENAASFVDQINSVVDQRLDDRRNKKTDLS